LHPAVNLMALGLDANFDLSRADWLINGIAGTSPETGTIGDLIWTDFVVNGDVAHEIDAREIPADWPEGYFPAGKTRPYPEPRVAAGSPE
ncbi:purine nucleoside permease, partial [Escherichia coli]|nr:purine nucleoside permease [Escherichia coli]